MDRDKQHEIASKGGRAAHEKGTAHEWTPSEAREAGRKGGVASHRKASETETAPRAAMTDETTSNASPEGTKTNDAFPFEW